MLEEDKKNNSENSFNEETYEEFLDDETEVELESKASPISGGKNTNKIFLFIIIAVAGFVIYSVFIKEEAPPPPEQARIEKTNESTKVPEVPEKIDIVPKEDTFVIPEPPVAPELTLSPPPSFSPSAPPVNNLIAPPVRSTTGNGEEDPNEALRNKLNANSIVVGGQGGGALVFGGKTSGIQKGSGEIGDSSAPNIFVTRVKNLENTILQGKMIDAVLETAIYTELNGVLRAVVSQDVYAEKGKRILIPKGSRLVGNYNTNVNIGQSRVFIVWTRLIRPDGIDAQISSPATDLQGRAGADGVVDNKFFESFANAVLSSVISIGIAAGAEAITDSGGIESRETPSGSTVDSADLTDLAVLDAVNNLAKLTNDAANRKLQVTPTITIDQGERIKVFVNRDVKFPSTFTDYGVRVIK